MALDTSTNLLSAKKTSSLSFLLDSRRDIYDINFSSSMIFVHMWWPCDHSDAKPTGGFNSSTGLPISVLQ